MHALRESIERRKHARRNGNKKCLIGLNGKPNTPTLYVVVPNPVLITPKTKCHDYDIAENLTALHSGS